MAKKDDIYEEDPFGKTIREIYDDIDQRIAARKETEGYEQYLDGYEPEFWQEDANDILMDVGIEYEFKISEYSKEKLDRIHEYYKDNAEVLNDDAILVPNDPIPTYYSGNGKTEVELYNLGYALGSTGEVGKYYLLLPILSFSRGFWTGKFEKAVKDDNDDLILDVSRDIKVFDPTTAEDELASIVNKCFSDNLVEDVDKPKTI